MCRMFHRILPIAVLAGMLSAPAPPAAAAGAKPQDPAATKPARPTALDAILAGGVPSGPEDLLAMERQFHQVAAKVTGATVGVAKRGGSGSGVIVTPDGLVLTVGHVSREAGLDVTILLPDGRRARGRTLGADLGVDAGMVRILDKPPKGGWPCRPLGDSTRLKPGQWVLAAGHPGGFRRGRTPPMRIGRILRSTPTVIITDCTIVSGDSGGPLFDMDGKVVGISSRISGSLDGNIHVPVEAFRRNWKRLTDGEVFDSRRRGPEVAYLGVAPDPDAPDGTLRIGQVLPGTGAEKAGIRAGDVVQKVDGRPVTDWADLVGRIRGHKPGQKIRITLRRGTKTVTIQATLGRRP